MPYLSAFLAKMIKRANLAKTDYEKNGFAYGISKNFVCWYAAKSAFDLGLKGIRVVSLSPGLIATDMGKLEEEMVAFYLNLRVKNVWAKLKNWDLQLQRLRMNEMDILLV